VCRNFPNTFMTTSSVRRGKQNVWSGTITQVRGRNAAPKLGARAGDNTLTVARARWRKRDDARLSGR
jgi:hypothetical protein